MRGDLLVDRWRPEIGEAELDGAVDQAVHAQPVIVEVALLQRRVLRGVGVDAVVPGVGADVGLGVLTGGRVQVLEQALRRPDEGVADALHGAGVPEREGGLRRPTPPSG